jgi:adenylate cyclase
MPVEIERKYLVSSDAWREHATGRHYRQGYLSINPDCTVRVRLVDEEAWLTIKGKTRVATRAEYEYTIPASHAREMLDTLCVHPLIEKIRYRVEYRGMLWEIDEFEGDNAGLVVAEIELESEGQDFALPEWVGKDVTADPRYYNANLSRQPFTRWSE